MPAPDLEELDRRVSASQAMLDRVIHTNDNLDERVGRIFTSMSFLTVGATILFTSFLTNRLLFQVGGVDMVAVLFVGFMVSVAAATGYMLQAMGPRIRLRPGPSAGKGAGPSPTGYADKIAGTKASDWAEYFKSIELRDLYEKWFYESMEEVHALSRKVNRKAGEMRRAQGAFLLAIVFLMAMIVLAIYQLL